MTLEEVMNLDRMNMKIKVLDHGYVKYIGHMGSDETVIEAARMSTGKGFLGWSWEQDTYADVICVSCRTQHLHDDLPEVEDDDDSNWMGAKICTNCWSIDIVTLSDDDELAGTATDPALKAQVADVQRKLIGKQGARKDIGLLEYLMANRHSTPFEMCELSLEVKLPIMVVREWHRHRTQSYNEMSGRYIQMPDEHYIPDIDRIRAQSTGNKQGSGEAISTGIAIGIINSMSGDQAEVYANYRAYLNQNVAKEIARINTPVSRYTRMRVKANLRNWLAFLSLRMENNAQWEIRQYAQAIAHMINCIWPKTFNLWWKHEFTAVRFSGDEMALFRKLLEANAETIVWPGTVSNKAKEALLKKISTDRDVEYLDARRVILNGNFDKE